MCTTPYASPLAPYVLLCLVLLLTIGCKTSGPVTGSQRLADAWMAALNAHDERQIASLTTDTALYDDPMVGGPLPLRGYWSSTWTRAPQLKFFVHRSICADDRVLIEWRSPRGPAGHTIDLKGVFVLDVQGKRIMRGRAYYNPLDLMPLLSVR